MTEEQGLLNAVIADPMDDLPRLVIADWYEEHGQAEKAEFIRVQCEMAKFPARPLRHHDRCREESPYVGCALCEWSITQFDRLVALSKRENELRAGMYEFGGDVTFRRGFISEVRGTLASLRNHLPEIRRSHPVTAVTVTDREPLEFDGRYLWHNADHRLTSSDYDGDDRPADHLPACVFNSLTGFIPRSGRVTDAVRGYASRHAAMVAVQAAATEGLIAESIARNLVAV